MSRLVFAFLITVVAAALTTPTVAAAPVPADNNPTTFPYPAKAPVVFCLNGYDKARDRLATMLKAALPEEGAKLSKQFNDLIGKALEGRKLTGIRKDARAFMVLNEIAGLIEGRVPASVLIPVTGYKEFRESFLSKDELKTFEKGKDGVDSVKTSVTGDESTLYLVDLNEYVAATPDKGVADAYAVKFTRASSETMGAEVASAYLKADVALFVNMDAINEQYGDQIRNFRGLIDFGVQQAQQQGALGGVTKKQIEAMKTLFKGLFQGVEDCRALVLTSEFKPEGLVVRLQARFAENTPSAKLIDSEKSYPLKDLEKLPKGFAIYNQTRVGDTFTQLMHEFAMDFAAPEDDEKSANAVKKFFKDTQAAGSQGSWAASDFSGTGLTVSGYKDAAKADQALIQMYKSIPAGGNVAGMVLKTAPKVTEAAQKYQGFTLAEVRLQIDIEATVASIPEPGREAAMEELKKVIPEKTTMWVGTDGKVLVNLTGKSWEQAKAALEKYASGQNLIGSDAAFQATRDQLPANATMVVIGEAAATISGFYDQMKSGLQSLPGAPAFGELKKVKADATYVGFAISTKGDTFAFTVFIPTSSVAVGRKMLAPVFKNIE